MSDQTPIPLSEREPDKWPCEMRAAKTDGTPFERWHVIDSEHDRFNAECRGVLWHSWRPLPDSPTAPEVVPDRSAHGLLESCLNKGNSASGPTSSAPASETATPRTDRVRNHLLEILRQHRSGHIYDADLEGFIHGVLEDVATLEKELAEARAWKESALAVERSWNRQEVGRLLELPLGSDIRAGIEPAIRALRRQLAEANHTLEAYRVRARKLYTPEVAATKIAEDEERMRNVDLRLATLTAAAEQAKGALEQVRDTSITMKDAMLPKWDSERAKGISVLFYEAPERLRERSCSTLAALSAALEKKEGV